MPATPGDFGFRISDFGFSEAPRETVRARRRCLAFRHDGVLNIMAACLASSQPVGKGEYGGGAWHPLVRIAEALMGLEKSEIRNPKSEIIEW